MNENELGYIVMNNLVQNGLLYLGAATIHPQNGVYSAPIYNIITINCNIHHNDRKKKITNFLYYNSRKLVIFTTMILNTLTYTP